MGAVTHELSDRLVGGKIDRIYQPSASDIILGVNVPREKERRVLLVSANSSLPRSYLSKLAAANPQSPPAFCMLLRKHLIGGRIANISGPPSERILFITVDTRSELGVPEKKTLVFELMGKHSNIMLVRGEAAHGGVIIDSVKRVYPDMSRVRQALPGLEYELPPASSGLSPVIKEELAAGRTLREFDDLAQANDYTPRIWLDEAGAMRDFHVFRLGVYEGLHYQTYDTVSEMLEAWFEGKETGNRIQQKSADLTQAVAARLKKALLKKQRLLEDLAAAEKAGDYREKGELITANIYRLQRGMSSAALEDYASGRDVTVALDPLLTPAQNAQQYYKKYTKAKTAKTAKRGQLTITQREIDYLESYRIWLADAKSDADLDALREELVTLGYLKRKKHATRPSSSAAKKLTYDLGGGFTATVGKNNRENDELTTRTAQPYDLWLHTKDIPGSHVILSSAYGVTAGRTADPAEVYGETAIRRAAAIAAYYSKARDSSNVPVDYTYIRYVKKPAGAKLGMVIFTHNKTLYTDPALPE
jgi:predicted ribosome quality control (RQC) complex YloA/Tae2 family protein